MKPIYFTIDNSRKLMVVPDTAAHLDGHPVITQTYSIYKYGEKLTSKQMFAINSELHLEKKHDPDYMGELTVEVPGRVYNYVSDGRDNLNPHEVQELVAELNRYRDDSSLWAAEE